MHWYRFIKTKDISIPQEINFIGKSEEDNGATMSFIAEKQQKTILFFLYSLIVIEKNNNGASKNIKFSEWTKLF